MEGNGDKLSIVKGSLSICINLLQLTQSKPQEIDVARRRTIEDQYNMMAD